MELYHNNMSVCAQKVRLVLAAKSLEPVEHHMMLRNGDVHTAAYLKLNPKGVVPTLLDHGAVIIESAVICEYLDEAYPDPPLAPPQAIDRARMRLWTMLPDAELHAACGALSVGVAWRHQILASGGGQLTNRPNRNGDTDVLRDIVERGLDSLYVKRAVGVYYAIVQKLVAVLSLNPWVAGEEYSLADIAMLPYICRLEDLGLAWFWEGNQSVMNDWLDRSKALKSYQGIANYTDRSYVALATEKGQEATPQIRALLEGGS